MSEYKNIIEEELYKLFPNQNRGFDKLMESMNYSLMAGGKRIRPALILEFCRISGGDYNSAIPLACAIEMIHTYSLIHDDLPCMDNDDMRRGKPTNHIVYGECTATLAGDALQAEAFRTILNSNLESDIKCNCANVLAYAAGINGICGGQYLDTVNDNYDITEFELNEINTRKTGAMLVAACKMGAIAGKANNQQIIAAEKFGDLIGKAFQIKDDVLDVTSTVEILGKPINSDKENNKKTYMAIYGEEKCNDIINDLTLKAKEVIKEAFSDTDFLCNLADSLANRNN